MTRWSAPLCSTEHLPPAAVDVRKSRPRQCPGRVGSSSWDLSYPFNCQGDSFNRPRTDKHSPGRHGKPRQHVDPFCTIFSSLLGFRFPSRRGPWQADRDEIELPVPFPPRYHFGSGASLLAGHWTLESLKLMSRMVPRGEICKAKRKVHLDPPRWKLSAPPCAG